MESVEDGGWEDERIGWESRILRIGGGRNTER